MQNSSSLKLFLAVAHVFAFSISVIHASETVSGSGEYLLKRLESRAGLVPSSWKIPGIRLDDTSEDDSRKGVVLRGTAEIAGAKAELPVLRSIPEGTEKISVYVKSPDNPAKRPGIFAWAGIDAEGENIFSETPVDWTGWKSVEIIPETAIWKSSFKQDGKNGKYDPPLKSLNLCWFSSGKGEQELSFSEITAKLDSASHCPISAYPDDNFSLAEWVSPDKGLSFSMVFNNPSPKDMDISLECILFPSRDSILPVCPDVKRGSDLAAGCKIRTFFNGECISDYVIDNLSRSNYVEKMASKKDGIESIKEMTQIIDLGKPFAVNGLEIYNGDSNWIYMLDIAGSNDGSNFEDIPDLAGIRLFHKWLGAEISSKNEKPYRYIRLHYHTKGLGEGEFGPGKVADGGGSSWFRLPCIIKIYDGLGNEDTSLSSYGEKELFRKKLSLKIPPLSWRKATIEIPADKLSSEGCYMLGLRMEQNGRLEKLEYRRFFAWEPLKDRPKESPFGINLSGADRVDAQMGMTEGRFENMKWFMCSPERNKYAFDGSVAPWHVNHDQIFTALAELGINPLPMMLGVPKYASSKPDAGKRTYYYPPANPDDYRQFAFQVAARYGSKKTPDEKLLTQDKKSGLDLIKVFEIWNEPDLNNPEWGALVGSFSDYFPILRAGYEGVKAADSDAKVTNGGLAGFSFDKWEELRKYRYPDGKHALDFMDIMNIHHYCGRKGPEESAANVNVNRSGPAPEDPPYYLQLRKLCQWRDKNKAGAPLWITETGWDTIGGKFVSETDQAAYLVRTGILSVAYGAEKVYIYREKDSGNSLYASCGLIRKDGSFKPSLFAYSNMIKEIQNAKCIGRIPVSENVFAFLFKRNDGKNIITAWSPSGTGNMSLDEKPILIKDCFGAPVNIEGTELKLSGFPVYVGISEKSAEALSKKVSEAAKIEKAKEDADLNRTAILLDFGSDEFPSYAIEYMRPYEIVDASTKWDESTKFGFTNGAKKVEIKRWLKDPLLCDSIRCDKESGFNVSVPRGKYNVKYAVNPFSTAGLKISLDGKLLLQAELPVDEGKNTFELSVDKPSSILNFSADNYCAWTYIEIIEK